ncbi:hypothetical protein [uncultured Cohaesibacter sp.]|uniref:hypothetical protein n=1 Tax=uncultured Cohaesibacter sp. TaxID=1002546 RepID=UPI00292CD349|nr:hypothetical protein [uncultured Cohaesibacter sp.]
MTAILSSNGNRNLKSAKPASVRLALASLPLLFFVAGCASTHQELATTSKQKSQAVLTTARESFELLNETTVEQEAAAYPTISNIATTDPTLLSQEEQEAIKKELLLLNPNLQK